MSWRFVARTEEKQVHVWDPSEDCMMYNGRDYARGCAIHYLDGSTWWINMVI